MQIRARKADLFWNYGGLLFRMAGQLLLLPLVLSLLDSEYVGLWYVFQSISSFIATFQSGFSPTFARNVAYCWSGKRTFSRSGLGDDSAGRVDWGVFRCLVSACRLVYRTISFVALAAIGTLGTAYVLGVAGGLEPLSYVPAWAVFCIAVFLNIFFSYYESLLRGIGDFVGVNIATIVSSALQIAATVVMLAAGMGVVSCSLGFLLQGVVFRMACRHFFFSGEGVAAGLASAAEPGSREVRSMVSTISANAFRDSVVSVANYLATAANTLLCAAFVGLSESSAFSVSLQVLNACVNVSSVVLTTYQPSLQSAYANGDRAMERLLSARSVVSFHALYAFCLAVLVTVGVPLLELLKPGASLSVPLTLALGLYLMLWKQQSICATLIANTNHIPYMVPFVVSSLAGIALSALLLHVSGGSVYALIAGEALAQAVYNNWKWPHEAASRLGMSYADFLTLGFTEIATSCRSFLRRMLSQ